jgi:hypothetical protein
MKSPGSSESGDNNVNPHPPLAPVDTADNLLVFYDTPVV